MSRNFQSMKRLRGSITRCRDWCSNKETSVHGCLHLFLAMQSVVKGETCTTYVRLRIIMKKRRMNTTVPTDWAPLQDAMNLSGMTRCSLYKLLKLANGDIENAK